MSKDTYYFSHDYNARSDRKLIAVIMKHGMTGIGIYWCIVEMLYEEGGYLPLEYDRITFELREEKNVIRDLILHSNLFEFDEEKFWSNTILERLNKRCQKSEKARKSVAERWKKGKENTNVLQTYTERNTIKERKGKENIYIPPEKILEKENKNIQYLPIATKLSEIIKTTKNISHTTSQISSWTNSIRKLVDQNKIEPKRIRMALRWYGNHIGEPYVPDIQSGESLREKFIKLEAAMNRIDYSTVKKTNPEDDYEHDAPIADQFIKQHEARTK